MITATMTLTEFLLARIAEDEVRVREEGIHPGGPPGLGSCLPDWEERRWLDECKSKRWIVALHVEEGSSGKPWNFCAECRFGYQARDEWPCITLRCLAFVYSDHPDYRDEWKP